MAPAALSILQVIFVVWGAGLVGPALVVAVILVCAGHDDLHAVSRSMAE